MISELTRDLVHHLLDDTVELDAGTVMAAQRGLIDYFAVSLQAHAAPEIQPLLRWIEQEGGSPDAWLLGYNRQVTSRQAALFNGMQAHLLDYDDVHADVRGHPSAVILSALFSLATPDDSGRDLLRAYVQGVELMARLGRAVHPYHYEHGWHNTATLGVLAATAALCVLRHLSATETTQALALAVTQASGLRLMFGTPVKPLHAGLAAQAAVQAVTWVCAGLVAAGTPDKDPFDPERGFLAVYGDTCVDVEDSEARTVKNQSSLVADWGHSWRISQPGLWFKTNPCCSAAAHLIDAAQALYQRHHWQLADLVRVTIQFATNTDKALIYKTPVTGEQGRFSAEYIVLLALTGQSLDFTAFAAETRIPHAMTDALGRVTRTYPASGDVLPEGLSYPAGRFARVTVTTTSGLTDSALCTVPWGCPLKPYPTPALVQKLIQASSPDQANTLVDAIDRLPDSTLQTLFQVGISPKPHRSL